MPQDYKNVAYSLGQGPLSNFAPSPIVARRAPTVADKNHELGSLWLEPSANLAWVLVSVVNNSATWLSVNSATAGSLASLTITGAAPNFTINSMSSPGVLVNNALGQVSSQALTNGQLLIGSTGAAAVPATLTAGAGIVISNGPGSITISEAGGGFSWSAEVANFNAAVGNGYVITAGSGSVTASLPAAAALGDSVEVLYPSATAGDVMILAAGAGNILVPGNSSVAGATLTFPDCSLAGSANPSVEVICVNAVGPVWQVAVLNGSPVLS